ncbi:methyltransferase [Pseudomonas arcuscaelestis]|uniref:methyltransferase n=1 Tax=Pseudomonas arcuscaelestis TaxID=2710591 RepID=UPI002E29B689|nr:methyltransferase [Pseudomonas arcuscaelestis]
MAKLSKVAAKLHQQALDLVYSDKPLRLDDRYFILENFHESATNMNGLAGAFFTPEGLANDFSIEVPECKSLIDLCAGIGRLAFACRERAERIVCVELNPEYAAVGKRVMPEAEWIVSDVFALGDLGRFNVAISNPPFGAVKTGHAFNGRYTGASFEYKLIEVASKIADHGVFIIPQASAPFRYSGQPNFRVEITRECQKFMDQSGVLLEHNCGLDTSAYLDEWHGVSPMCEIVLCDFTQPHSEEIEVPVLMVDSESVRHSAPVCLEPVAEPAGQVMAAVLECPAREPEPEPEPVPVPVPVPARAERTKIKAATPGYSQLSLFDAA